MFLKDLKKLKKIKKLSTIEYFEFRKKVNFRFVTILIN